MFFFFSRRHNPLWVCIHSPLAGFSLLFRGFKITHNDAPQSVGLLRTIDQFVVETSTWQHTTLTTDKRPCPRWYSNPQSQQARGLRPRSYWDRPLLCLSVGYWLGQSQVCTAVPFRSMAFCVVTPCSLIRGYHNVLPCAVERDLTIPRLPVQVLTDV